MDVYGNGGRRMSLRKTIENQQREIDALRRALADSRERFQSFVNKINILRSRDKALSDENKILKERLSDEQEKNVVLRKENIVLQNQHKKHIHDVCMDGNSIYKKSWWTLFKSKVFK